MSTGSATPTNPKKAEKKPVLNDFVYSINEKNGSYVIEGEIVFHKDGAPVSGEKIVFKDGVKVLNGETDQITSVNGLATFVYRWPLNMSEKTIGIRIHPESNASIERKIDITFPAGKKTKPATHGEIKVIGTDGVYRLVAQLLDEDNHPVQGNITVIQYDKHGDIIPQTKEENCSMFTKNQTFQTNPNGYLCLKLKDFNETNEHGLHRRINVRIDGTLKDPSYPLLAPSKTENLSVFDKLLKLFSRS